MTVIDSADFAINQDKYFDMAINGQVMVQRGTNIFIIMSANDHGGHYSPEFVEKIRKAEQNISEGKFVHVKDVNNIWNNIP
jgi:hypothetical protein